MLVIGASPARPLEHPGRERLYKDGPTQHEFVLPSAARACAETPPAVPCLLPIAMIVPASNERPETDCEPMRVLKAFLCC